MNLRPRITSALRTIVWIAFALLGSVLNLTHSGASPENPSPYLLLAMLAALTVPFVLVWRRRFPELILGITVIAALLVPIGATASWVALGSLIRSRRSPITQDPWQWAGIVGVTGVTYLAVLRDLSAVDPRDSMTGSFLGESAGPNWSAELPWHTTPLLTVTLMAIVLGIIAIARARAQAAQESRRAAGTERANAELSEEVARYEERERIARELHDSLGNTLASVSMLSGAVRAQAHDPHAVSSHAEQLQHVAREATTQMHEIVSTYRGHAPPVTTLADIHTLITQNQARGALIHAEVKVHDSDQAHGIVERAVYRVIQELLTNAVKHAPTHVLTLQVSGGPSHGGVRIVASNPIPLYPPMPHPTGGSGILGSAERVEQLGGWLQIKTDNGIFLVHVWIPWRQRPGG